LLSPWKGKVLNVELRHEVCSWVDRWRRDSDFFFLRLRSTGDILVLVHDNTFWLCTKASNYTYRRILKPIVNNLWRKISQIHELETGRIFVIENANLFSFPIPCNLNRTNTMVPKVVLRNNIPYGSVAVDRSGNCYMTSFFGLLPYISVYKRLENITYAFESY
jgi:hypothetical protein